MSKVQWTGRPRLYVVAEKTRTASNKKGNVHLLCNIERIRVTTVDVEEQWVLHILSVCL